MNSRLLDIFHRIVDCKRQLNLITFSTAAESLELGSRQEALINACIHYMHCQPIGHSGSKVKPYLVF